MPYDKIPNYKLTAQLIHSELFANVWGYGISMYRVNDMLQPYTRINLINY